MNFRKECEIYSLRTQSVNWNQSAIPAMFWRQRRFLVPVPPPTPRSRHQNKLRTQYIDKKLFYLLPSHSGSSSHAMLTLTLWSKAFLQPPVRLMSNVYTKSPLSFFVFPFRFCFCFVVLIQWNASQTSRRFAFFRTAASFHRQRFVHRRLTTWAGVGCGTRHDERHKTATLANQL